MRIKAVRMNLPLRANTPDPACSSNLTAVLADIWQRLAYGTTTSKAPCHLLSVGTVWNYSHPDQRMMVLRDVDTKAGILRFHTDARSPKAKQIAEHNVVSILQYDAVAKVQLRLGGTAWVEQDGDIADAAWTSAVPSSRRCYLGASPSQSSEYPTSGLAPDLENRVPLLAETEAGRANFAVFRVMLTHMDWLYLAHDGHRRAGFMRDEETIWQGHWLTP